MKIKNLLLLALGFGIATSCTEEDLDPTLAQSKSIEESINTVNDLNAVLIGGYDRLTTSTYYGRNIIILGEVFADNASSNANSNRFVVEARMDLLPTTATALDLWQQAYRVIGSANIVINAEGIEGDQESIDHLKGQAYAMRALAHFDLVKFFGQQHVSNGGLGSPGVPYVTTFRDNDALFPARNTVQEVRDLAYADLQSARELMSESMDTSTEYITTHAVDALEARIANYFGDWQQSLVASKRIIDSGDFSIASESSFLNNFATDGGSNIIFELAFSSTDNIGINGLANIYQEGSYGDVIALPNLAAIYDEGDVRGATSYDPATDAQPGSIIGIHPNGALRNVGKYPSTAPYDDNIPLIRYEEIILIYAEALLETGAAGEALIWLNMIPAQRGAELYTVATKTNILLERRKELAFEGFRFHDLARTGSNIPLLDPVQQTHGGPEYGSYNFALPIPASEANTNANIPQNFGY